LRESFNKAVLLLTEARLAREKSDFSLAESKLFVAKAMLFSADQKARRMLEDYFGSFPQWTALVKDAVSKSAYQNSTVIIVDKMAHKFRIYNNGQLKYTFNAEFGPNWIGQKQHRGDHATPEGLYRIVHKKDRRNTAYYKALLLNYPNEEDRVRYRKSLSSGRVSSRIDVGGSIEIHGDGGRGFDWTNGCIALANKDMDVVFNMASERTPVVIVGSVESLEKYMYYVVQEKN
jgi:murein L,D-transpeptidase YafK